MISPAMSASRAGDNRGPEVTEYLRNAGIGVAAAWCAAWVQWISDKATLINSAPNPLDAVAREALVADYVTLAEERGWIVDVSRVRRGISSASALGALTVEPYWDRHGPAPADLRRLGPGAYDRGQYQQVRLPRGRRRVPEKALRIPWTGLLHSVGHA